VTGVRVQALARVLARPSSDERVVASLPVPTFHNGTEALRAVVMSISKTLSSPRCPAWAATLTYSRDARRATTCANRNGCGKRFGTPSDYLWRRGLRTQRPRATDQTSGTVSTTINDAA
jgi:hypothetical protein